MLQAFIEITIILLLVIANGLLAGAEIAVVSARKTRLAQRAREGDEGARKALDLARSPNRFLSTVQIGITAIAVVAGAVGGARVASTLAPFMYVHLLFSMAVSLVLFGDVPDFWTVAGAGIIAAAGLYIIYRERQLHIRSVSEDLPL